MSINLNQLVQRAFDEGVSRQLAARVGCTPESAKRVVSLCAPALIGSSMNQASSVEGARSLFAAIVSPGVSMHIAEELPSFVTHDEGMEALLAAGASADGAVASYEHLNRLSERIAEYTGVPASATRTLAGIVGATVLGLLKRHFVQHGARLGQLPGLLGDQLPVVRANMTDGFAHALGLGSVGAFLTAVPSRLKAVSSHLEFPAAWDAVASPVHGDSHRARETRDEPKEKPGGRKWLWVANAAALALLAGLVARGCSTEDKSRQTESDAQADASTAVAGSAPAQGSLPSVTPRQDAVAFFTADASGVLALDATVGSEQERRRLIGLLSSKLGANGFHANVTVDPERAPSAWLDKLDALLPVLTLPGARVRIAGDTIELGGQAADAKLGWRDKLKAVFGADWRIGTSAVRADAPVSGATDTSGTSGTSGVSSTSSTSDASAASRESGGGTCSARAVVRMLNLQPINFRIGSKTPPPAAMAALVKQAKALEACGGQAAPIKLRIAGYSDNTGSAALNVRLSKQRAQAVRAYLVKHGVPAAWLTAQGFGEARPIGDNATRAGRLANRRVEFEEAN